MFRKIKYLILFTAFLPMVINAQKTHAIQGYVFDDATGLPMYNIYVECNNPARSLITEPSGKFRFDSLDNTKHQLKFIDPRGNYISIDSTMFPTDTLQQINVMMAITMKTSCRYYKELAAKAIESKKIFFLTETLPSLISQNDTNFEKKYKVGYSLSWEGCTTIPQDCIREYNKIISAYLTKTYGKRWKKKVRKDVLF